MARQFFLGIFTACIVGCAATIPVSANVYKGGDDGLTNRLHDLVKQKVAQPGALRTRSTLQPDLAIYIVGHVNWEERGDDVEVIYQVRFTSSRKNNEAIAPTRGSCFESNLEACAQQIVRAAQKFLD